MVTIEVQLEKLELKDGDIVILRSDDWGALCGIPDAYYVQEGAKKVHFWLLGNHESIQALTEEEKIALREQLDG